MKYFNQSEFVMGKENVFNKMDTSLLARIDILRENVGKPLHITSSFRSVDYNKSVGGASKSQHLLGKAVDLSCKNSILRATIVFQALKLGLTVGVAKSFIHIDCRETQIVFSY